MKARAAIWLTIQSSQMNRKGNRIRSLIETEYVNLIEVNGKFTIYRIELYQSSDPKRLRLRKILRNVWQNYRDRHTGN